MGASAPRDDHDARIHRLQPSIGPTEQIGIRFRIHGARRAGSPLRGDVGLVPDLIVEHPPAIAPGHHLGEIGEILGVVRRGESAPGFPIVARPGRRAGEPHDQAQAIAPRQIHNVIVFLPGRPIGDMPAVLEIPLPMDLDVRPRELLADPAEAGLGDHAHGPLPLLRLHFLLQESVHPKRGIIRVGNGSIGGQLQRRTQGVREVMENPTQTGQRVFLPGHLIGPGHARRESPGGFPGNQEQKDPGEDEPASRHPGIPSGRNWRRAGRKLQDIRI